MFYPFEASHMEDNVHDHQSLLFACLSVEHHQLATLAKDNSSHFGRKKCIVDNTI